MNYDDPQADWQTETLHLSNAEKARHSRYNHDNFNDLADVEYEIRLLSAWRKPAARLAENADKENTAAKPLDNQRLK